VVADRLPKISYLTLLDWYLLCSYGAMVCLVALICTVMLLQQQLSHYNSTPSDEAASASNSAPTILLQYLIDTPDIYQLICGVSIWSLFHLILAYIFCYDMYKPLFWYLDRISFLWSWTPLATYWRLEKSRQTQVAFQSIVYKVVGVVRGSSSKSPSKDT
jgi:hypothetical protein